MIRACVRAVLAAAATLVVLGSTAAVATAAGTSRTALPGCNQSNAFDWNDGKYFHMPTANGSTQCVMGSGAAGFHVRTLQEALRWCYGKSIAIDDRFGTQTRTALREVQYQERVTVDGVYGPETGLEMKWPLFRNGSYIYECLHLNP